MNVLFVSDGYYPICCASANCVYLIIKALMLHNVQVDVLNITGDTSLPKEIVTDSYHITNVFNNIYMKLDSAGYQRTSPIKKIRIITEKLIYKFSHSISKSPISFFAVRNIEKKLLCTGNSYDVIIPVVSNINNAVACIDYCKKQKKKCIIYQVDPIGSNMAYDEKCRQKLHRLEVKLYAAADRIITTPIIAREKKHSTQFDSDKILALEFPNVRDLTTTSSANTDKEIVCSFCGYIYHGVRDCKYVLELFSHFIDPAIKIKFAGQGQEDVIHSYAENGLKDRIEHVGHLLAEQSIAFMQASDFLINIGNSMTNQVPSKLFDYISTGKPIINICVNVDCPTIPYMDRYGLSINIVEGQEPLITQAEKVERFIHEQYGKCKTTESIQNGFFENTASYVGQKFYEVIIDIGV